MVSYPYNRLSALRPSAMQRIGRGVGLTLRQSVRAATFPVRFAKRLWRGRGRNPGGPSYRAAELAADEGFAALSRSLADPDPMVRSLALDVICEFSEERAARLLSGALYDPDPSVRCAAAKAAARLRATSTVFSLILTLDDRDPDVRTASSEAITAITGRDVDLSNADDPASRSQQVAELKQWWKQERFERLKAAASSKAS